MSDEMSPEELEERIAVLRAKQDELEAASLHERAEKVRQRISELEDKVDYTSSGDTEVSELEERVEWYESRGWDSAAESARERLKQIRGESE